MRSFFGAIEDWNNRGLTEDFLAYALRSFFGAIEDWNCSGNPSDPRVSIAIVLRGDRGLEPEYSNRGLAGSTHCDRSSGRSRIGTTYGISAGEQTILRSFFGAIEDWNYLKELPEKVQKIAIVLRGDRGLEQDRIREIVNRVGYCDRSSGRSRIGTKSRPLGIVGSEDCDRSSGRSRIGTRSQAGVECAR